MGDPAKLGSLGAKTLAVYMLTTLAAIVLGLVLAAALQPGVGVDLSAAAPTAVQGQQHFISSLKKMVMKLPKRHFLTAIGSSAN